MDLRHYDGVNIGTTKLEDAMHEILSAIGVVSFDATFYDFRYPNATNMMLIAEAIYTTGDASFSVYLPADFTYYDRSWSHALYQVENTDESTLYLDENSISHFYVWGANYTWWLAHGSFTTPQLPPGVSHNVRLHLYEYRDDDNNRAFCGMALVYKEVP
jgi:hypothetical protein